MISCAVMRIVSKMKAFAGGGCIGFVPQVKSDLT